MDRPFGVYWIYQREQVFKRDHYACRLCGDGLHLEVHHLRYRVQPLYELLTLCKGCHAKVHRKDKHELRFFNRDWMEFLKGGAEE